jgi:DHA2 family integral membrane protein (MFS transporter)
VLGSILSTTYRSGIDSHLGVLPASDRHAAGESVEATLSVAEKLGPAGRVLVRPAHDAFIHAMHITAMGSAAVALIGAVVVLLFLPRKNTPVAAGGDKSQPQVVGAKG